MSVIVLSALIAENVLARELSEQALAKIQPEVLENFLNHDKRELILLFEYSNIAEQAHLAKEKGGLQFETSAIQHLKTQAYSGIKNTVLKALGQNEIQALYTYDSLPMMFARVATPEALRRLLEDDQVLRVFENRQHSLALAESLPLIGQPETYAAGHGGKGTTVAILDSGTDYKKAAFGYCVSPGVPDDCKVIFAKDFTAVDDGFLDVHGHGTNVSAIVAGVAPDAKIAALDVFVGSFLYTADAIAAIDWVIANQSSLNIVAMNLSFGTGLYDQICDQSWATIPFSHARAVGVAPVVASGNDAKKAELLMPACAPGAIRVGAVYDNNIGPQAFRRCSDKITQTDLVACFSNSSQNLDLLAPGAMVTAGELTFSGTSMATPHVSGAVAVMKGESAYPDDSLETTIQRLKSSGKQVLDERNGLMFPRLDLEAALIELLPDQVPEISHFTPEVAPEGGELQIHGSGFRGVDTVTIGDTAAHQFTVNSSQSITAIVGPGSSGEVQVATSEGSDSLPGFTYIKSVRETEPNNNMIEANPVMLVNERLAGAVSGQSDVDVFRFGFDVGEVSFGIRSVRAICCSKFIQATLQDGQGTVLASVRIDEAANEPVAIEASIDRRGAYYLVVSETSQQEAVFIHDYHIKVPENIYPNRSPEFTSIPSGAVFVDENFKYPLQALDPDGDPVYFSIQSGPAGMVLDQQSQTITWQPVSGQAGIDHVELLVFDDFGGIGIQEFEIAVIDDSLLQVNATDGSYKNHVQVSFNLIEGATVYRVFRCIDSGETCGSPVGYVKKGTFYDTRAVPGVMYYYRVRVCIATKCAPLSTADMGFASVAPAKPTGIRATDGTYPDRVRVTFNPVEDAVLYRVFRCLDTGQTCGLPVAYPRGTSSDDTRASPGIIYYYRVKACNTRHCGRFSVVNIGHTAFKSRAGAEKLLQDNDKVIPVLGDSGRWLLVLMLLGVGFIARYRAWKTGKVDLC